MQDGKLAVHFGGLLQEDHSCLLEVDRVTQTTEEVNVISKPLCRNPPAGPLISLEAEETNQAHPLSLNDPLYRNRPDQPLVVVPRRIS